MGIEPEHPEIPFPLPPARTPPQRTEPLMVPMVSITGGDAWERLSEQRRVLVSGRLDRDALTELSAKLMAFDGASSRDVEIVINSLGGPLAEIFPVLDVLDLMRAKVHATVVGSAVGTALAVVAGATGERRAAPNTMFGLRVDSGHAFDGSADEFARAMFDLEAIRSRYVARLAATTGLDVETLTIEIDRGEIFDARRAVELGIVDSITELANPRQRPESSGSSASPS